MIRNLPSLFDRSSCESRVESRRIDSNLRDELFAVCLFSYAPTDKSPTRLCLNPKHASIYIPKSVDLDLSADLIPVGGSWRGGSRSAGAARAADGAWERDISGSCVCGVCVCVLGVVLYVYVCVLI